MEDTSVEELVKIVNEIIMNCRKHPCCSTCPYFNTKTIECRIHIEGLAEHPPYMW